MKEILLRETIERNNGILKLPFACVNLIGCEMLADAIAVSHPRDASQEPLNPFRDAFDPRKVAMYCKNNTQGLFEDWVRLPKDLIRIRSQNDEGVDEVFDTCTEAAMQLVQDVLAYKRKFWLRDQNTGRFIEERPTTSDRQADYKSSMRARVQRSYTTYLMRTIWKFKSVVRSYLFKKPHPGFMAHLIPDPSLAVDEVGVPVDIYPIFEQDKDAIVLRHPVLEIMYRLRPVKISQRVVGLSPELFKVIGGDADGDQVYVTPIPKDLGYNPNDPDWYDRRCLGHVKHLKLDEAVVLVDKPDVKGQIMDMHHPVDVPPLSLRSLLNGSFCTQMQNQGVRKYNNPLSRPLDPESLWIESMGAAAGFSYEKAAIGRADKIRRSLLIVFDEPEVLRSINLFCADVTQKALDSAKHKVSFPLNEYADIWEADTKDEHGRKDKATNLNQLKADLRSLPDVQNVDDGEFVLEKLLEKFPNFLRLGLSGIIELYYPLWDMQSGKKVYDSRSLRTPQEVNSIMHLETALPSVANLHF